MQTNVRCGLRFLAMVAICGAMAANPAAPPSEADSLRKAAQLQQDNNHAEAYELYRSMAVDPQSTAAAQSLDGAARALDELGWSEQLDGLLSEAMAAHPTDPALLHAVAQEWLDATDWGVLIDGTFQRGGNRGQGLPVSAADRDRVRALQALVQALPHLAQVPPAERSALLFTLADVLLADERDDDQAWRLTRTTDLVTLPDYEEGGGQPMGRFGWGGGVRSSGSGGAPVDADGNPVYYRLPETFAAAANDGERWRWAVTEAARQNLAVANEALLRRATFLRSQFGVTTLAGDASFAALFDQPQAAAQTPPEPGPYAVHTLEDDETIARLATGVRRFRLPDDQNFIRLYQQAAAANPPSETAAVALAGVYADRRQYATAAARWREVIERFGKGDHDRYKQQLTQITGNWFQFETVDLQPAGTAATLPIRFRNGRGITFTAHNVKFGLLLADVQAYLAARPQSLDWSKLNVENIGYRLVQENETRYRGEQVATWEQPLDPPAGHVDGQADIATPLSAAGVYLVTGTIKGGNRSNILLWISDTALVQKTLSGTLLHYVADAASGAPVPNATVECLGYQQRYEGGRPQRIGIAQQTGVTDANGLLTLKLDTQYQWLITARAAGDRFAYLGFSGVWYPDPAVAQTARTRAYIVTDRPVYRPGQSVRYKAWLRAADYAKPHASASSAGKTYQVQIRDPQGEVLQSQMLTADEFGGLSGEFTLGDEAALGVYIVSISQNLIDDSSTFRVEEYKKPEYEVTIDAPTEPVLLGEPITATIQARYYFGEPVTQASVLYKVTRSPHTSVWYPAARWDWCYGPGYWWFRSNAGWNRPLPRGGWRPWPFQPPEPPEIVAESDVPIGPDGRVEVTIDTALAEQLHGDTDHKYTITAEVTDASRRTITGTGSVFAPRQPFQVFAWVDRGFYAVGDPIEATFQAQTIAEQPVSGPATVTLTQITYDAAGTPTQRMVQTVQATTNDDGRLTHTFTAAAAGQYRVSASVTDAAGHRIDGGYVFDVLPHQQATDPSDFRYDGLEITADNREYQPGETARLLVTAQQPNATVLLFVRVQDGGTPAPQVLHLQGRTQVVELRIEARDRPNLFVEALTVSAGRVQTAVKELVVPPADNILNVAIGLPQTEYKPGETAEIDVRLTDAAGNPVVAALAATMYDRSIEYISGGSNVADIRKFFWSWQRHYSESHRDNLAQTFSQLVQRDQVTMQTLGVFGGLNVVAMGGADGSRFRRGGMGGGFGGMGGGGLGGAPMRMAAPMEASPKSSLMEVADETADEAEQAPLAAATLRSNFADTALWEPACVSDADGHVTLAATLPEDLTQWTFRAWAVGNGTAVGEATAMLVTRKNVLVRMQSPRFLTETDEVLLSANVHNYLDTDKQAQVSLALDGETLIFLDEPTRTVTVPAGGEVRVDWRVQAVAPGAAHITMQALTDEESDAVRRTLPVYIHGQLRTDSYTGTINARPADDLPADQAPGNQVSEASFTFRIPEQRRINDSLVVVRFSPSLAAAMVDALPYLSGYPYGCTEQTLNRFLPTVITQRTLKQMGLSLADIREKQANLNPQEIGDPQRRAEQRAAAVGQISPPHNPVWDAAEVEKMAQAGLKRLIGMQAADGGWGWFPGSNASNAHLTAVVVHGLLVAQPAGVKVPQDVLNRGVAWLQSYQNQQIAAIRRGQAKEKNAHKTPARQSGCPCVRRLDGSRRPQWQRDERPAVPVPGRFDRIFPGLVWPVAPDARHAGAVGDGLAQPVAVSGGR